MNSMLRSLHRVYNSSVPVGVYQTFTLARPRTPDFWRNATCDEVNCRRKREGWRTVLDIGTATGARDAKWIVDHSGRHGTIERAGNQVTFTFAAGQDCFERHRVAHEREPVYIVRDGDHRGNPTGRRRIHQRGADWVDHMQNDLDKLRQARKQG
jgi:hypothetical protein